MVTIFWPPEWIHMMDMLPKGERFNSQHFEQNVLYGICANLSPAGMAKPILIRTDNAPPHRSKETLTYMKYSNFHPVPHRAFSPDLAPSDFYFFGTIKRRLRRRTLQEPDELDEAVREETSFIRRSELHAAFRN
jgi:transposase